MVATVVLNVPPEIVRLSIVRTGVPVAAPKSTLWSMVRSSMVTVTRSTNPVEPASGMIASSLPTLG